MTYLKDKQKEFEKKFLDQYGFWNITNIYRDGGKIHAGRVWDFTSQAITEAREEMIKKIEGMKRMDYVENTEYIKNGTLEADRYNQRKDGYNQAIDDILTLLKEPKGES